MAEVTTLSRWSELLLEEIFQDREGEGRPVSTIDAGSALLSRALARAGVPATDDLALELFVSAFPPRWQVLRWFSGIDEPRNCLLAFLILCCVAASEASGSDANDFRERIRQMMGWDAVAVDCAALPLLWQRLSKCLATAPAERRYRSLILPNPRFRSQIGHAIELTFPSRQDGRRLKRNLDEGGLTDPRHPVEVMKWVSARSKRFSPAFQDTFADFVSEWKNGERALTDHRFWTGWQIVVESWRPILTHEAFHIIGDEWGRYQIVTQAGDPTTLAEIERSAPAGLRQHLANGSSVLLREIDWGEWTWAGQGPPAARAARAALVREKSYSRSFLEQLNLAPVAGATGWLFTAAVDVLPAADGRLSRDEDDLVDARFSGVPRIDGGRLARPSFPIELSTTGLVEDVRLTGDVAPQIELKRRGANGWLLVPRTAINGDVRVCLEAGGGVLRRMISLRASSVAPDWVRDLPPRYFRDELPTPAWCPTTQDQPCSGFQVDSAAVETCAPCQELLDLMEYLAARPSPMALGGLLDLLDTLPGIQQVGRWAGVRALMEGGLIDPLRVRGWRGGAVLPRAPRAVLVPKVGAPGLRLDGIVNEVLISRLQGVAKKLGLEISASDGVGGWSPQVFTIVGPRELLEALAAELGLGIQHLTPGLAGHARPGTLPNADGINHVYRQLIPSSNSEALANRGLRLVLCRREAEDSPPVWLIEKEGCEPRYWTHRHLALLDACAIAAILPAQVNASRLTLSAEGAFLPLEAARWLRLASGVASGPADGAYHYALTPRLEPLVREFLGLRMQPAEAASRAPIRGGAIAIPQGVSVDVVPTWRWVRKRTGVLQ